MLQTSCVEVDEKKTQRLWKRTIQQLSREDAMDCSKWRKLINKNSSGDEIANVNFFYNIAHVEASAYAH